MAKTKYIVIDGLIGTGKTHLSQYIAQKNKSRLVLDQVDNPFIRQFLKDIGKGNSENALKTQLIYLINRFQQQQELLQKNLFSSMTISDYLFHRDAIYAHLVLNDEELDIYKKIYQTFTEKIRNPDLVVYLQISFAEMLKRIQSSEDDVVRRVPVDFWREVFEAFNYYFFNYKATPLLVVNMERVNITSSRDLDPLWNEIEKHQTGTRYYAPA